VTLTQIASPFGSLHVDDGGAGELAVSICSCLWREHGPLVRATGTPAQEEDGRGS
jgi:hypothetical protein